MPTMAVLADGTNESHDRVSSSAVVKAAIAPGYFIVLRLFICGENCNYGIVGGSFVVP